MQRYKLRQGKLREDDTGEWVRADESERLDQLVTDLAEWVRTCDHAKGCESQSDNPCTCGLENVLARVENHQPTEREER